MTVGGRIDARAGKRMRAHTRVAPLHRCRRILPTILLCIALALTGSVARAIADDTQTTSTRPTPIVVGLSDAMLNLPIPPGYCAIAPTAPDLAQSFAAVEASFGKGTCLLAWFVECGVLEAVRAGTAPSVTLFADYGLYVTPINDDGVFQQFPDMTRATFVREIACSMPPFDREPLSITVAKSQSFHDKTDSGLLMSTREIGLLSSDAHAYYLATAAELTRNDERRALLGVAATTLVHRIAVSTIIYGGPNGAFTLDMLEERARAVTLSLIAANPGGDGSDRSVAFDANRLSLIGFAVALLIVTIGLVSLAWRSWYRRYALRP